MLNRGLLGSLSRQTALRAAAGALLVTTAALLLFLLPAEAQASETTISGVTLTSPNPGELVITWDAPSRAPDDYRVTWKKSTAKWPSYKDDNTALGGNAFPTGTTHTVTGLENGTAYQARVRARYHDGNGNVEESGPWSDTVELTVTAEEENGDSTNPPVKPTGLSTSATHSSVLLSWTDPGDSTITSYQVLRGPGADNLAVLVDSTGSATSSYTDDSVAAETIYVYAIRSRNAHGLSPPSDTVSVTTPAAPPAKPTGVDVGTTHFSVLLLWNDPDDDTITGYQVLRGDAEDSLAVLTDDTGSAATTSYTDASVEAATTYYYAIRARNANGLSEPSDPVTATTHAAPPEPEIAQQISGAEFNLDGEDLDTTGTCDETDIAAIAAGCTINIETKSPVLVVVGSIDLDDRLSIKTGRDKAAVDAATTIVNQDGFVGAVPSATLTFPEGRNLMRIWGDEDTSPGGSEEHFFRVNVVPHWEWNGDRLSKDTACQSTSSRTAAQITDEDCIATQSGNAADLRFHNTIRDQYNVYVDVNGARVITEPNDTELNASFTVSLALSP